MKVKTQDWVLVSTTKKEPPQWLVEGPWSQEEQGQEGWWSRGAWGRLRGLKAVTKGAEGTAALWVSHMTHCHARKIPEGLVCTPEASVPCAAWPKGLAKEKGPTSLDQMDTYFVQHNPSRNVMGRERAQGPPMEQTWPG